MFPLAQASYEHPSWMCQSSWVHGRALSQICEISWILKNSPMRSAFLLRFYYFLKKILTISQLNLGHSHAKS